MNRLLTTLLTLVVSACLMQGAQAQWTNSKIINGQKVSKPWADVVGRKVIVEGLAWGALEKGLGQHVVLANHSVYVRNIDYLKHKAHGRLVRVIGTLRIGSVSKAPPGTAGFAKDIEYFYLDVDEWEIVDQVSSPWMEEVMPAAGR